MSVGNLGSINPTKISDIQVSVKHCLVLEDQLNTAKWLQQILVELFPDAKVFLAKTLAEAEQILRENIPNLALIDLGLPDGSGNLILKRIKACSPQAVCVVTTIFDDDEHLFSALAAGADGYVLKELAQSELKQMIVGLLDDKPALSPAIARRLITYFNKSPSVGKEPTPASEQLTKREIEVLTLIAKGYTVANAAMLLDISHNTAAGYTKNIYRKLNVTSRAEATMEASRMGIIDF